MGEQIEIHIYNTANHNHTGAATICTHDIGNQTINNQIQLTNTGTHDIEAHVHASVAVTSTIIGGLCGNSANPTSVYNGKETLMATAVPTTSSTVS